MKTPVRFFGHSIHQTLVVFPMGLLVTSLGFDLLQVVTGMPILADVAYWTLVAGLIGAVVAIPFGTLDWLSVPAGTRAKRIGALHGVGNVVVTALFVISWWTRTADQVPSAFAVGTSGVATALLLTTAWLGGELVSRLTVGVHEDAHLDAPSSLRDTSGARMASARADGSARSTLTRPGSSSSFSATDAR